MHLLFASLITPIAIVVLVIAVRRARIGRLDRRSLTSICPATQRRANLLALEDPKSGRLVDVVRCSELPEGARCRKTCLMLANCERLFGDRSPSVR